MLKNLINSLLNELKKTTYRLEKEYDIKVFLSDNIKLAKEIRDYLTEQGIDSRINENSWKNIRINGKSEGVKVEAYTTLKIERGILGYKIKFDGKSPKQREKADEILSILVKYNPKNS